MDPPIAPEPVDLATATVEELFGDKKTNQELDALVARLEAIAGADMRKLFDETGKITSPKDWKDAEADAITRFTRSDTNAGVSWNIQFVSKERVLEQLARLKGMYRNDEEVENPLATALARIPRAELIAMAQQLKRLAVLDGEEDGGIGAEVQDPA